MPHPPGRRAYCGLADGVAGEVLLPLEPPIGEELGMAPLPVDEPPAPPIGDELGMAPLVLPAPPPIGDELGDAPLVLPAPSPSGEELGDAPLVPPVVEPEPVVDEPAPPVVVPLDPMDDPLVEVSGDALVAAPLPLVPPVLGWVLIVEPVLPALVPLVPVARTSAGRPHPSSAVAAKVAR